MDQHQGSDQKSFPGQSQAGWGEQVEETASKLGVTPETFIQASILRMLELSESYQLELCSLYLQRKSWAVQDLEVFLTLPEGGEKASA